MINRRGLGQAAVGLAFAGLATRASSNTSVATTGYGPLLADPGGLLDQAATAALLIVGSRGVGGVKGLLLGSTSRSLVERANVPVVVVPHRERS